MAEREKRIVSFRALRALIREDLTMVNGQFSRPGFQALAVQRFGVWVQGLRPAVLRVPLRALYRLSAIFVRNVYGIELWPETPIGRRVRFTHQHGITVAKNASIGDDCLIRQMVTIGHHAPGEDGRPKPGPQIGDRVSVGVGAVVTGSITIGNDTVIGPNAVVMWDVPEGAMVTATPSRIMPRPPRRRIETETLVVETVS